MADKLTERFLNNERKRHTETIQQCASRIQENAGYLLARLASGASLTGYDLVRDALEIERRLAALGAISDITGIYEAAAEDANNG